MSTLDELKKGALLGAKELSLSCALETFPEEILTLSDTLEKLDLAHNNLSELPPTFKQLKKLRILFLSFNQFKKVPEILSQCPHLTIVGFKTNQITELPENAFPRSLRWLILTDNKIEELPHSIGDLTLLEKVALAGNKIKKIPEEFSRCRNLGLLRLCANQLAQIPEWLLAMPKLAWLAVAGNPCCNNSTPAKTQLPLIAYNDLTFHEILGQGASGTTYKATRNLPDTTLEEVAVKIFKSQLSSDGFASDEIAAHEIIGTAPHLLSACGILSDTPQHSMGIALPLVPRSYSALGNIPSFDSCTRDCYDDSCRFSPENVATVALQVARAGKHLHKKSVMHGDLYAHNILINETGNCLLGDYGAASWYGSFDRTGKDHFERIDALAYGHLLEELLSRIEPSAADTAFPILKILEKIKTSCLAPSVISRPTFSQIAQLISEG